jgi:hypothetical protein
MLTISPPHTAFARVNYLHQNSELRIAADRLMLKKAYARSVLRWRGHRIPTLNELETAVRRSPSVII